MYLLTPNPNPISHRDGCLRFLSRLLKWLCFQSSAHGPGSGVATYRKHFFYGSKVSLTMICCAISGFWVTRAHAVDTINWGTALDASIVSSNNTALNNAFTFQLGAFTSGFAPTALNITSWAANWHVFDQTTLTPFGGFTGQAYIDSAGRTSSAQGDSAFSFSNLTAYIWVFNTKSILPNSTEWFLGGNDTWVFTPGSPEPCCGAESAVRNWGMAGLDNQDVPAFGGQKAIRSVPGEADIRNNASVIQTFDFGAVTPL